jgi:hypothetical protein
MACIPWSEPFAFEHVAEMTTASGALYLHAFTVGVRKPADRPGNFLVERRPAAVGVELVVRPVEGCAALFTLVNSRRYGAFIFSRERRFGALVKDHTLFGAGQGPEGRAGIGHVLSNRNLY